MLGDWVRNVRAWRAGGCVGHAPVGPECGKNFKTTTALLRYQLGFTECKHFCCPFPPDNWEDIVEEVPSLLEVPGISKEKPDCCLPRHLRLMDIVGKCRVKGKFNDLKTMVAQADSHGVLSKIAHKLLRKVRGWCRADRLTYHRMCVTVVVYPSWSRQSLRRPWTWIPRA